MHHCSLGPGAVRVRQHLCLGFGEHQIHINGCEVSIQELAIPTKLAELCAVHLIHVLHGGKTFSAGDIQLTATRCSFRPCLQELEGSI